jgi:hypothetical protein
LRKRKKALREQVPFSLCAENGLYAEEFNPAPPSFRRKPESSSNTLSEGHKTGFECSARFIKTGFRPAPE